MLLECGHTYVTSDNEEILLMKLVLYFQQCGVELLVIDEVQHIKRPELKRRVLEVSNMTRGIPIICASCHPIEWRDLRCGGEGTLERFLSPQTIHRVTIE